ncbi:MAG: hypothetical protein QOF70_1070 [Acetobacteraceae bacterium]|jgi:hypothetical protein|nr:hypothetical protein [Acetobacteraceae bacterium]
MYIGVFPNSLRYPAEKALKMGYYTMTGVLHALCNAHYAAPRIMPTDAWEPAPEAVIAAMGPA